MSQHYEPTDMPTTISVREDIADELYSRKERGESYNDVLERLLQKADAYDEGRDVDDVRGYEEREPEPAPEPAAEPQPTFGDLVETVGREVLPGSGEKLDRRVEALHATAEYLRENGQATPADFKRDVYPQHTGMYVEGNDPPRSWWKNAIYKGMSEVAQRSDEIQAAGTDGKWRYTGGEK